MAKLIVLTRDGFQHVIEGDTTLSVMENIRNAGIDEMQALCGGSCSCATCHVHVEGGNSEALSPISDDEHDLLDTTNDRRADSRLACQIAFVAACDGLRVRIAPED